MVIFTEVTLTFRGITMVITIIITIIIILNRDELEVCNPLGSNAGTHKVDMHYYSIGNLNPKFR